jgi:hypothetical protein
MKYFTIIIFDIQYKIYIIDILEIINIFVFMPIK